MVDAILSLIPGGTLTAIGAAVSAVALLLWRAFAAGKASGIDKAKAERADSYEREMERIEKAAAARADAERRARAGELHDKWTRPD